MSMGNLAVPFQTQMDLIDLVDFRLVLEDVATPVVYFGIAI